MTTNPDEQAFPAIAPNDEGWEGLTKREYFAAIALQGLLASGQKLLAAREAVEKADQLINELNKDQA